MKKNRGITLIALIITIVVMLIIISVVISQVSEKSNDIALESMYADIELLEDKILGYYNKYGELPIKGEAIANEIVQTFDAGAYYEINLTKLDNITLNYGDRSDGENDIYVVNTSTLKVYYLEGIESNGEIYHLSNELSNQIEKVLIKVEIEGIGTVDGATAEGIEYAIGSVINLRATPGSINANETSVNYVFGGWYSNDILLSTELLYSPTIIEEVTYKAVFIPSSTLIYCTTDGVESIISDNRAELTGYGSRTDITKVEVGNSCNQIRGYAFSGCTNLKEFSMNEVIIGSYVFENCTELEKVIMLRPTFSTSNSGQQFKNCTKLKEVVIGCVGNPIDSLPSALFTYCTQYELIIKIYVEDGATIISNSSWRATNSTIEYYSATTGDLMSIYLGFRYNGDTTIETISNGEKINLIKSYAVSGCTSLKELSMNEVIVGSNAFENCTNLEKVVILKPTFNTNNGGQQFRYCTKLKEVIIGSVGNPIDSLPNALFSYCAQYELIIKIYIADGTTSISGSPWRATNATIEYYNATTGEKIN